MQSQHQYLGLSPTVYEGKENHEKEKRETNEVGGEEKGKGRRHYYSTSLRWSPNPKVPHVYTNLKPGIFPFSIYREGVLSVFLVLVCLGKTTLGRAHPNG